MALGRWLLRSSLGLGALVATVALSHLVIVYRAQLQPPHVDVSHLEMREQAPGLRWLGSSYVYEADGIIEARLEGNPAEIGWAMGKLLRPDIVQTEQRLYRTFDRYVPKAWAQALLLDWGRLRYAHLDRNLSMGIREELAALGLALAPDPMASLMPTYQRLVFLSSLYDVSLSFEHAPVVGCTTFLVRGDSSVEGHSFLARNFDFEIDDVFDKKKVIYLMIERGALPYASVAWPGLPGAVSAMNSAGVAIVVHGGRAGTFDNQGEPVLETMRFVMGHAQSTRDAVEILRQHQPMVSHIVIVTDPSGHAEVVERVPRQPLYAYRVPERAVITNHFVGPSADDPANVSVREATTSVPRMQRGQQLLARRTRRLGAPDLVAMLRDRRGINDQPLPLGDRRAISALIAAHGVVFDTNARKLWVSSPPHLLGTFVELDLNQLFLANVDPQIAGKRRRFLPADELYTSGQYETWLASGSLTVKHR